LVAVPLVMAKERKTYESILSNSRGSSRACCWLAVARQCEFIRSQLVNPLSLTWTRRRGPLSWFQSLMVKAWQSVLSRRLMWRCRLWRAMLAQIKLDNPNVDAQTKLDFQTAVIDLAKRSQFISFQREALFRLCEQGMNQNLSSEQIFVLYQQVLQTSLKLAEAELAKNKAELAKALKDPAVRQLWNQLGGRRRFR
jgi:hypothetical protein